MPKPFTCPKCGFDCELAPRHNCVDNDEKLLEYKYGVEYPTNGKKPDLPDDVIVMIRINNKFYKNQWSPASRSVDNVLWDDVVTAFRVVDERYKPKETKLETDNSWYERGELPPVGVKCEMKLDDDWIFCKLIGYDEDKPIFKLELPKGGGFEITYLPCTGCKFRPIKTEREKFVEAARNCFNQSDKNKVLSSIAEALYDAGFRAPE